MMIIYSNREHKYLKDRKADSLLTSICFEVQRASREDFVGLGHNRRKIKIIQDDWYKMIGTLLLLVHDDSDFPELSGSLWALLPCY